MIVEKLYFRLFNFNIILRPNSGWYRPRSFAFLVILVFGTVYCLESLVNHYLFRTYAADLGIFNHALYSFSHFRADHITLHLYGDDPLFLGDHFSPLIMLFSPFYLLFGSYTLLIFQIISILAAGWAVYLFAHDHTDKRWLPLLVMIHFYTLWAINSALAFDFHANVIAAMLLPWLVLFYFRGQKAGVLVMFVLIIIAKENMALWMAFILPALMLMKRKNFTTYLKLEIPLILFSLLYFYVVVDHIMPFLQQGKGTLQMVRYAYLGKNIPDIITNLITHPSLILDALTSNILPDPQYNGIKGEFHLMMLVSGGLALLFRPAWLFMLIPVYAQKLLTNDYAFWGINNHYSVEVAPVLSMALFDALKRIPRNWVSYAAGAFFILLSCYFSFQKIENRKSQYYNRINYRFYKKEHYQSPVNVKAVYEILREIPPGISLSVSAELAPHLAFREKLYHFPLVRNADCVVVFSDKKGDYPVSRDQRLQLIDQLQQSGEYSKTLDRDDIIILKKNTALLPGTPVQLK